VERRLVTGGLGEARGLDRVTAALTADGRLTVAYLPVRRPVELQLATLAAGRATVEWFEPGTGRRLPGGTLVTEGHVVLAPPFESDSVLLLSARD